MDEFKIGDWICWDSWVGNDVRGFGRIDRMAFADDGRLLGYHLGVEECADTHYVIINDDWLRNVGKVRRCTPEEVRMIELKLMAEAL